MFDAQGILLFVLIATPLGKNLPGKLFLLLLGCGRVDNLAAFTSH